MEKYLKTIKKMANNNYEAYIKALFSYEFNVENKETLDRMFREYMDNDDYSTPLNLELKTKEDIVQINIDNLEELKQVYEDFGIEKLEDHIMEVSEVVDIYRDLLNSGDTFYTYLVTEELNYIMRAVEDNDASHVQFKDKI